MNLPLKIGYQLCIEMFCKLSYCIFLSISQEISPICLEYTIQLKKKNCVIYSYKINLDLSILPSYMIKGENVYLFIYINSWSWGIQAQDVFIKKIRKCQLNYNNLDKRKRILSYDFMDRINKLLAISIS